MAPFAPITTTDSLHDGFDGMDIALDLLQVEPRRAQLRVVRRSLLYDWRITMRMPVTACVEYFERVRLHCAGSDLPWDGVYSLIERGIMREFDTGTARHATQRGAKERSTSTTGPKTPKSKPSAPDDAALDTARSKGFCIKFNKGTCKENGDHTITNRGEPLNVTHHCGVCGKHGHGASTHRD
jgi:hypothetical protein